MKSCDRARLGRSASLAVMALFAFARIVCVPAPAAAQTAAPQAAPSGLPGDVGHAAVFGTDGDAGKLVARFFAFELWPGYVTGDKSGDSTLLRSPDGLTMLIDGGAPKCGPQLEAYLQALGVGRIDIVVATHPHVDHIGGLVDIMERHEIGVLYMNEVANPTGIYASFMETARRRGIPIAILREGMDFDFGDSVQVSVLNPPEGIGSLAVTPENATRFVNDSSLVLKLVYEDSSMLFMGDLYATGEARLLADHGSDLKADLLKAGHHGSDTSSSRPFVAAASPRYAVMMTDNLQSLRVYDSYRNTGASVLLTCMDGSVRVSVDSKGAWSVSRESERKNKYLK